jgi:hypothetical protein
VENFNCCAEASSAALQHPQYFRQQTKLARSYEGISVTVIEFVEMKKIQAEK